MNSAEGAGAPLQPGFADPISDAQRSFRAVLDAFARPGQLRALPEAPAVGGLSSAAAALCLTLLDYETTLWLSDDLRGGELRSWLSFHCGCPFSDDCGGADVALVGGASRPPPLEALRWGSDERPERSATLWIEAAAIARRPVPQAIKLCPQGPGVRSTEPLFVAGPGAPFWQQLDASRVSFPRGVDVLLLHQGQVAGLPRSTALGLGG